MTNVVGPRAATADSDDNELASLVRRWVGARRGGALRVAPEPPAAAPGDESDATPAAPSAEALARTEPAPSAPSAPSVPPSQPASSTAGDAGTELPPLAPARVLPRRPAGDDPDQPRRVAVLIDARRTSADVAAGLLERLPGRGSVTVCRAYAD